MSSPADWATRPFVDAPVTDQTAARRAAERALERWEADASDLSLMRVGMNAMFRTGAAVVRVGRATAPAVEAHRLATAVRSAGIDTVEPIDGWAADIDEHAVTGWRHVERARTGADLAAGDAEVWSTLGEMVSRTHALDRTRLPAAFPVPSATAFPWWDFAAMLDDVRADIDDVAWRGLSRAVELRAGWRERVEQQPVLCHGDVHPGNVLLDGDRTLLIDWDLVCVAAPAWDHAPLMGMAGRWGGDPAHYDAFADGYGSSMRDDELTNDLATLRDVAATLLKVRAARTSRRAATEAERRLRFWRGEPDAPLWVAQ